MSKLSFYVKACWDDEAKVYYSDSDIIGLHIEADTIEEFEGVMKDSAVELILANHVTPHEMSSMSIRDLIPGIFWQPPEKPELACA